MSPLDGVSVESFAASQPESSWDDFFAYAEEIFVHYQNIITSAIPVAIEIASWAAARFSDSLEFFEQSSSPVCLGISGSLPNHPALSAFDNLVGPLVFEARRRHGPRIPKHEYMQIARAIDHAKLKPLNHLEGKWRKDLATSNRDYRKAIHTFEAALGSRFKRGALKRIYRAHEKWQERHPNLSG
jgi:hypothetical protein